MANQEEVRDVYGYFEQKGNALCYRYEAERVRICLLYTSPSPRD